MHFDLIDAPTVTDELSGTEFQPTHGHWRAHSYGVFVAVGSYAEGAPDGGYWARFEHDVPDWIPRPPEGWDAGIKVMAAAAKAGLL